MIEYSARDYDELCATAIVRAEILTLEEKRRFVLRRFRRILLVSLLLAAATLYSMLRWGIPSWGIILAGIILIAGNAIGLHALNMVKEDLKIPVLETLAEKGGLEYLPDGFDPPVFPVAGRPLFGDVAGCRFSDLFHGEDKGKRFALYEGMVSLQKGRGTQFLFRGQFYAFQRRAAAAGKVLVLPDKGLFNLVDPDGMERVACDDDAFERQFEVYSSRPDAARAMIGAEVRAALLALRRNGKLWAYVGGGDVLVAVQGANLFEPGSLFRAESGPARIRRMFDQVCAQLAALRTLRSVLG